MIQPNSTQPKKKWQIFKIEEEKTVPEAIAHHNRSKKRDLNFDKRRSLSHWRMKGKLNEGNFFQELGFPRDAKTFGLFPFNGTHSEGFITVSLKFEWMDGFLPHHPHLITTRLFDETVVSNLKMGEWTKWAIPLFNAKKPMCTLSKLGQLSF